MANPFSLKIDGVNSGNDILARPAPSATTTPYVDLGTLNMVLTGDGTGSSMTFDVIQPVTPAGGAWWRSGGVQDNARVRFFDSRESATYPIFMGYVTNIEGRLLPNGLGSVASVSVSDVSGWLEKTIVQPLKTGIKATTYVDSFTQGGSTSTDQEHVNALLAKVAARITDATTLQLLDTSIISGSNRAYFTGTPVVIGPQTFRVTTLASALEQITEIAGGVGGSLYTYYIDNSGRLRYEIQDTAKSTSDAPAQIVSDPASVQVGNASNPTRLLARDIVVNYDHSDIVKAIFVQADSDYARYDSNQTFPTAPTNDPYYRTYTGSYSRNGAGLTARSGPIPVEVFSAPKIVAKSDRGATIGALARATMTSRGKPVRTVAFTLSGSSQTQTSSPDWSYGYCQGYNQSGTLVKAWYPGQYVKFTIPALDLGTVRDLYSIMRIQSVTMRFEGSETFQVAYDIEADFRRQYISGIRGILGGE